MMNNNHRTKWILPAIIVSQFFCTALWFAGNAILPNVIKNFTFKINLVSMQLCIETISLLFKFKSLRRHCDLKNVSCMWLLNNPAAHAIFTTSHKLSVNKCGGLFYISIVNST